MEALTAPAEQPAAVMVKTEAPEVDSAKTIPMVARDRPEEL